MAPAFLTTYVLYEAYPWTHTGEWVEAMLGLAFAFAALGAMGWSNARAVLVVALVPALLGALTTTGFNALHRDLPEFVEATRAESLALASDFSQQQIDPPCGFNRRLYTLAASSQGDGLRHGRFASLTGQGLPEDRAHFFLDPWNSPYWVRVACPEGSPRRAWVYSFGPNRRRDSTLAELLGDDIGAQIER